MRIILDVSKNELNALEDQAVCWNLCPKHNRILGASDVELYEFTQECRKCKAMNKELRGKVLQLWSKLCTAYEKAAKRKP